MAVSKGETLVGVSAAAFLGPFTQTVYAPSLPEMQGYFQVSTVAINLTISLFTAILAVSNFVVGPMADIWGRRTVLLPGLVIFCLGSSLCLFSGGSYALFLTGRAVQALGISTALVIAPTVIGDTYPPQERADPMSTYQTVTFLGPVFGPVIGGLIATYLHWQWAFAILVVAGAIVWLYNFRRLTETLPRGATPMKFAPRTLRGMVTNRSALAIILIGFSQFYGYYVFLVFLPALLTSLFALSTASQGFFFAPLTAGILVGISVGRFWQKHWSRVKILSTSSFAISSNVLLLWLALSAHLLNIPLLAAFLLTYGVLLGCSLPVQSTILLNLFKHEKGTAVGIYNFFRFTGAAIGPIAGGLVAIPFGINAVFLNVSVLLVASAWLIHRNLHDPLEAQ